MNAQRLAVAAMAAFLAACATARDYLQVRADWGSTFGIRGGYRGFVHNGIDIGADGDWVIAAADGIVYRAQKDLSGSNSVWLDHGLDADGRQIRTVYAHLAAI